MKTISLKNQSFNLIESYSISKDLSHEILLDEYFQSRGIHHSSLSEQFFKSKNQFARKIIFTKIFYAIIFGLLPIIPIFAYYEYINILTSGGMNFEFTIFIISMLYGIFFLLQFFNFLLMTIIETTVIMSGKSLGWLKTLPLSNLSLKKLLYVTIFRNFDIPISVIIFAFPIAVLITTANILFFLITLGISIINTFLGFNVMVIIGGRLGRVLNLYDISSKKSFLIRLFNVFSYVLIILGSIYLIQWASTSMENFFYLFSTFESPNLINIILSVIPYPFSQCYLIALTFSPTYPGISVILSTIIGMGFLVLIFYLTFKKAYNSINKVIHSEPIYKNRGIYVENFKESFRIKSTSTFRAFLRKDLLSATRDVKVFLSFISPIILSFIFVVYLNLARLSVSEPIEFQIFKTWLSYLLLTPILSGIIVFSLLNIDASGHSILESLPLLPREQAKAKLLIMFLLLTCSVVSPCFLFITNPRFLIFFFGIIACLPFAWLFLFLSFEMSIYFFGKRNKTYIVSDLSGKNIFRWVIILIMPLSICVWIISMSTLLFLQISPFELFFSLFISLTIIVGYTFVLLFFNKILPIIKIQKHQEDEPLHVSSKILNPTFFTRHLWISVITVLIFNFIFYFIRNYIDLFFHLFIPQPAPSLRGIIGFVDLLLFFAYYYGPLIVSNIFFIWIYFVIIPKKLGIPFGSKRTSQFLDDTGLNWIKPIYANLRYIIFGSISTIAIMFFYYFYTTNYFYYYNLNEFYNIIYIINIGFWFEIVFRGILLNVFINKYKIRYAILLHLLIIVIFYLFNIFIQVPMLDGFNLFFFIFEFLIFFLIIGGFNLIMDYVYVKTKSLLPNIIIAFSFIFFTYPIGMLIYIF